MLLRKDIGLSYSINEFSHVHMHACSHSHSHSLSVQVHMLCAYIPQEARGQCQVLFLRISPIWGLLLVLDFENRAGWMELTHPAKIPGQRMAGIIRICYIVPLFSMGSEDQPLVLTLAHKHFAN